jgi:hypothetical protein
VRSLPVRRVPLAAVVGPSACPTSAMPSDHAGARRRQQCKGTANLAVAEMVGEGRGIGRLTWVGVLGGLFAEMWSVGIVMICVLKV